MRCDGCGFVYEDVPAADLAPTLAGLPERYRDALAGATEEQLRRRPEPAVWSALEYTAHVRDVFLAQRDRTIHALVADNPSFAPMHRDERVELAHYDQESVEEVLTGIAIAGALVARVFTGRTEAELARPCIYNYPEPAPRDVLWIGRQTVHEGLHHLADVGAVLRGEPPG